MNVQIASMRRHLPRAEFERAPGRSSRPAVQLDADPATVAHAGSQHSSTPPAAWAHSVAKAGARGGGGPLPYRHAIEGSFGRDLAGVRAHTGVPARAAAGALNANAVTRGADVLFAGTSDLRTTAHEATHAVMQQAGLAPPSGLGRSGDAYEQRADAVAARVVAGQPAADLLPMERQHGVTAVQRDEPNKPEKASKPGKAPKPATKEGTGQPDPNLVSGPFVPNLITLMLSRKHGASTLDPSLKLKGTEWYDLWSLANTLSLSWGNMLLQNQALGPNAKGEQANDWYGTFEAMAKRNAKLFPGTGKEWTDQLQGGLSLIGGNRIPDLWGSDVFLELLKSHPWDVAALTFIAMAANSIYAGSTHKSTIEEAEPGTMETQQHLRHFGLSLWLAEKLYASQMGKSIGSFGGMPSALKPIWEQEPAGKGEKAGGELVLNPSKFWNPKGTDVSDPSKHKRWLFQLHGKYLYDRPPTPTETGGVIPPFTDPTHSFTAGMVLGRNPMAAMFETSARLGEGGDLTSLRLRSGLDLFPKVTGLDRVKLMYELYNIRAGDPLARGVDPDTYHRLFLDWSSGAFGGKQWKLGANASMAFSGDEAWFTGAGGRLDYRKGGWPKDGETFPAWGFSVFGGAENPQWWDKNAPLGGNVGLGLNLGNWFGGGSFNWRGADPRMKGLYGKEHAGGYQFGVNLGRVFP